MDHSIYLPTTVAAYPSYDTAHALPDVACESHQVVSKIAGFTELACTSLHQ